MDPVETTAASRTPLAASTLRDQGPPGPVPSALSALVRAARLLSQAAVASLVSLVVRRDLPATMVITVERGSTVDAPVELSLLTFRPLSLALSVVRSRLVSLLSPAASLRLAASPAVASLAVASPLLLVVSQEASLRAAPLSPRTLTSPPSPAAWHTHLVITATTATAVGRAASTADRPVAALLRRPLLLLHLTLSAARSLLEHPQALLPQAKSRLDPLPAVLLLLTALVLPVIILTALVLRVSPPVLVLPCLPPLELPQRLLLAWPVVLSVLDLSSLLVHPLLSPLVPAPLALLRAPVLPVPVPLESPVVLFPQVCVPLDPLLRASQAALLLLGLSLPLSVVRKSPFKHSTLATRSSLTLAEVPGGGWMSVELS